MIPVGAALVVIAAIIVLVLSRSEPKKSVAAGLGFAGNYAVQTTLTSAGIGADHGQSAGTLIRGQWQVTLELPELG